VFTKAFMLLAFGTIPMVIACYVVYQIYDIKNSYHPKRNRIFVFIPGIICASCAIFVVGLLFVGMINSSILR